jgi:antitoxin component YwqK of YwqJK toxin-antitoxin module
MLRFTYLFIFISLISFVVSSQEKVNYANLKSLRQDGEFIRFQVEEFNPKKDNKYDKSLTYHWYKSQSVMSTQGGSSGLLLDGIYEHFYANKQLATKGFFKQGLKHGTWTYWNKQGRLIKDEFWRKGKPKKSTLVYNESGDVKKEKNYGKKEVVSRSEEQVITTNMDSTEVEVVEKYKNGETKSVSHFKYGELHGKQIVYDENGKIVTLKNYKDGQLHGKQINEDGTKQHFKKGEEKTPLLKRIFKKKEDADKEGSEEEDNSENEKKESKRKKKEKSNKEEDFITN